MPKGAGDTDSKPEAFANQDEILLGVLDAVDRDARVSQRTIASELDIALGLTNAYLKRCMRKGWIRIQQVPRRRYLYYLTPQGFAEKARLTGQYLSSSFTFFRRAREQMSELMAECSQQGWNRIVFAGVSELAEVGTICAHEYPVELVGIVDPEHAGRTVCGLPVYAAFAECDGIDAVILTCLVDSATVFQAMEREIGTDRTLVPAMVRRVLPKPAPDSKVKSAAE
jgi:DNA-binding MarR family transcriptional regulator